MRSPRSVATWRSWPSAAQRRGRAARTRSPSASTSSTPVAGAARGRSPARSRRAGRSRGRRSPRSSARRRARPTGRCACEMPELADQLARPATTLVGIGARCRRPRAARRAVPRRPPDRSRRADGETEVLDVGLADQDLAGRGGTGAAEHADVLARALAPDQLAARRDVADAGGDDRGTTQHRSGPSRAAMSAGTSSRSSRGRAPPSRRRRLTVAVRHDRDGRARPDPRASKVSTSACCMARS